MINTFASHNNRFRLCESFWKLKDFAICYRCYTPSKNANDPWHFEETSLQKLECFEFTVDQAPEQVELLQRAVLDKAWRDH